MQQEKAKLNSKEQKKENNILNNVLNIADFLVSKKNNDDLKKWLSIKKELEQVKRTFVSRRWDVEYFYFFPGGLEKINESDLINLRKRNLIDDYTLNFLKNIEEKIFLLERKENLTQLDLETLEILKQTKLETLKQIEEKYNIKKEKVLFSLINHYKEKIAVLEKNMKEIESKPELRKEIETIKQKEKEKLEEFFKLIKENLKSVQAKNNRCYSMLATHLSDFFFKEFLIGAKDQQVKIDKNFVREKILDYYNDDPENKERYLAEQNFYNKLRKAIVQLILEGKIENEWEIIPSEMLNDGFNYLKSFNLIANEENIKFLSDLGFKDKNEKAKNLWAECEEVIIESKALLRIFKKFNKDGSLTLIWQTFKNKLEEKIIKSIKMTDDQKELLSKKIKEEKELFEILKQENSVPVFYYGKLKKEGKIENFVEVGAVVFDLEILKDGTKIWKVKDVYKVKGLERGKVSDYEMSNFPVWVRNAALINGLIKIEKNE